MKAIHWIFGWGGVAFLLLSLHSSKAEEASEEAALQELEAELQTEADPLAKELDSLEEIETPPTKETKDEFEVKDITQPALTAPPATETTEKRQFSAQKNEVTNLEFRMEQGTSRILVTATSKLNYREVRNSAMKQIVYFFENTSTPQKFQRAYDTTEFPSPIALFTMLQMPNTNPVQSKLIVQLREDKEPNIVNTDRGMYIDFPPTDHTVEPRLLLNQQNTIENGEQNVYAADYKFSGKPIKKLEIKNSDVQDVLRLIARSSGYNIVIGDDVTGKVGTMSIDNIPWDQAFALILQSKKLGYVKQGNVLRVGTLASLKTEKDEAMANETSKSKIEPLKTLLIPISYAKAAELSPRAKPFLTDRGNVDVDDRTNTIVVRDIEKVTTRIQKLFASLDTQPPKVNVAAKFVEMSQEFTRQIGFGRVFLKSSPVSGLSIEHEVINSTASGGNYSGKIDASSFSEFKALLDMGERDNRIRVLANPSIAINSNQQGSISQGITYQFLTSESAGGATTLQLKTITANLNLEVTPIVAGDGSISMKVAIRNEIPDGQPPSVTVATRNVSTNILVENGDTAVIGGVFQNTVSNRLEGVPFLMRIPILGMLFSNKGLTDRRSEILVFLTAKILNAESSFKHTL